MLEVILGGGSGLQAGTSITGGNGRSSGNTVRKTVSSLFLVAALAPTCFAQNVPVPARLEQAVANNAAQLSKWCPVSDTASQAAFDSCRRRMFDGSLMKQMLGSIVFWGRQRDPKLALKDSHLTQFAPDILSGLYMPLFMFDGKYTIAYDEKEKLFLARLGIAFRNRLQPGQFPYPFWHEEKKWDGYQNANEMLLWFEPISEKVKVAQFAPTGSPIAGVKLSKLSHPQHDGKWLWTDSEGKVQPAVTLFDGLYQEANPYKKNLDKAYRDFAVSLRESQCLNCHVPDNPDKMKRLVLMQTPAHASAEIERILKSVREKKMPLDDQGIEKAMDQNVEQVFLEKGAAFEAIVKAAKDWELINKTK